MNLKFRICSGIIVWLAIFLLMPFGVNISLFDDGVKPFVHWTGIIFVTITSVISLYWLVVFIRLLFQFKKIIHNETFR